MNSFFKLLFATLLVAQLDALQVRVLLRDGTDTWTVSSARGLTLRDALDHKRIFPQNATTSTLTIAKEGDYIRVNGKKLSSKKAWIEPLDKHLTIEDRTYEGKFLLVYDQSKWLLINVLDSEEYVYSVLKTESWPGWPLEVNKSFAIACRSYLLYQLLFSRTKDAEYHIKSTNYHQTYQGIHNDPVLRQAVEETRGVFLAHNEQPILAMFDCCCGGVVPAKVKNGMDFSKVPYLARKKACTFCKGTKLYEWKATYTVDQFTSIMKESHDRVIHPIREVAVVHRDKAGLVQKVAIKTRHDFFDITARQMNLFFKGVKSHCFTILKKGKKITVRGKGYGHHIGMCQWGAREMIRKGWSHKDVLEFYYPGTYFMQLRS